MTSVAGSVGGGWGALDWPAWARLQVRLINGGVVGLLSGWPDGGGVGCVLSGLTYLSGGAPGARNPWRQAPLPDPVGKPTRGRWARCSETNLVTELKFSEVPGAPVEGQERLHPVKVDAI